MNLDFYVPPTRRLKRSLCAKDVMLIQSYCVEVKPEKLKILLFEFSAEMVVDCQRYATLCVDVPELLKITGFEWFFHILLTSVRTPSFVLFRFSQFILQRWFSSLKQIVIEFFVLHNQSRYFFSLHGIQSNVWSKFFWGLLCGFRNVDVSVKDTLEDLGSSLFHKPYGTFMDWYCTY